MSHNQRMERKTQQSTTPTKEKATTQTEKQNFGREDVTQGALSKGGVFLSNQDAEEYRIYKRRKKLNEISALISATEGSVIDGEDVQRICERAVRLKQSAVKLPLSKTTQVGYYLSGSKVQMDCVIGGDGETLGKVKAYETKLARRRKAKEITVSVTPSFMDGCRYGEIRKELKRIARVAGRMKIKVRVGKSYTPTPLSRVARIAGEIGASFFSVPYFAGCERLCTELLNGCRLEVTGVDDAETFKRLTDNGVARVVTNNAQEFHAYLLKETEEEISKLFTSATAKENPPEEEPNPNSPEYETPPLPPTPDMPAPPCLLKDKENENAITTQTPTPSSETDYRCCLDGTQLKFL